MHEALDPPGWSWFDAPPVEELSTELVESAMQRICTSNDGKIILDYLRTTFLERRLPPSASDAELRHLEGQRSVAARLVRLAQPKTRQNGSRR